MRNIPIHKEKWEKVQGPPCLLIQWRLPPREDGLRQVKAAGSSQFQKHVIYNSEVTGGRHGVGRSDGEGVPSWPVFQSWVPMNKQKEHLEFIKCLKYNKHAYISEDIKKNSPPLAKQASGKGIKGNVNFWQFSWDLI